MFDHITDDYRKSKKRVFLLDYDGTLIPFTDIPENAVITEDVYQILSKLTHIKENRVIVISGRDNKFLQKQFSRLHVDLIAEHGYMIKLKKGEWKYNARSDGKWKESVRKLFEDITAILPKAFTEEKNASLVLHYRTAKITTENLGKVRIKVEEFSSNNPKLEVLFGNHVIEIKIAGFSKGSVALKLLNRLKPDFLVAIGDDVTDETLFRELKGRAYTIKVGDGDSEATFRLPSQKDVIPFLEHFLY